MTRSQAIRTIDSPTSGRDKLTSASVIDVNVEDHQIPDFLPPPRLAAVLPGEAAINVSLLSGRVGSFQSS